MFKKMHRSRLATGFVAALALVGSSAALVSQPAAAAGPPTILALSSVLRVPLVGVIYIGKPFLYIVRVNNNGAGNNEVLVDGATITGTMPSGLTMNAVPSLFASGGGIVAFTPTLDCSASSTSAISCTVNNIPTNGWVDIQLPGDAATNLDPTSLATLTTTLASTQVNSSSGTTITSNIDPYPDDIAVTVGSVAIAVGGSGIVPLTLRNTDPAVTTNSTVTGRFELPASTPGLTITTVPAGCVLVASPPAGKIQYDCTTTGRLLPNASQTFSFGVSAAAGAASTSVTAAGNLVLGPTINDTNTANNVGSGVISVGPTAANDSLNVGYGSSYSGNGIVANDVIAAGATFAKTTNPTNGTATVSAAGVVTYTPNANFTGTDSFTYTVTNPNGLSAVATVIMHIAPGAVNDSASTPAGTAVIATAATNDVASAGATWSKLSGPTNGTAAMTSAGSYTYTPNAGFSGTDSFTYQVTNPDGSQGTATVSISVTPKAANDALTMVANAVGNGMVSGNDVYAIGAAFSKTSGPSHGSVTLAADGNYNYTPTAGYSGPDSFAYLITNPDGTTAAAVVSISVTPIANNDSNATSVNTAVTGSVKANDVANAAAVFALASGAGHGTVTVQPGGSYTYTPTTGYVGNDSFTYTVTNPDGTFASATVAISVSFVAVTAPMAVNDVFSLPFGSVASGTVANNDTWLPGATWAVATGPTHGTLTLASTGGYTYTPAAGYSGPDTFTYVLTNPNGLTSTALVTINVGPRALSDDIRTTAGTPVSGDVSTNDNVSVGATFSKATDPAHGTVVVNANGTYTYTPSASFSGVDTFTYLVVNPDGSSATATVTVHVGPRAASISIVTTGTAAGNANDGGLAAPGATCALQSGATRGALILNPDCTYSYTASPGFAGQDSFTYRLTNPDGTNSSGTVTINVRKTGQLPATGTDALGLAGLALALAAVGGLMVAVSRRRRVL